MAVAPLSPPERLPPGTVGLFVAVLIVAACGLVYELVAGALASYVLGDSVTQFSLVIGLYMFAMGIGAHLSGYLEERLGRRRVRIGDARLLRCARSADDLLPARSPDGRRDGLVVADLDRRQELTARSYERRGLSIP